MANRINCLIVGSLLALLAPISGYAVVTNPLPALFGPDDGSELFIPDQLTITSELVDALPANGIFGFYFSNDPGTRITIFDTTDNPGSATAVINFAVGAVIDVDAGNTVQSVFTVNANPIGFFYEMVPPLAVIPTNPIYTQSSLNLLGVDLIATFPSLTTPNAYLLGFEAVISVPGTAPQVQTIAFEVQTGIRAVPAPSALALLLIGGLGWLGTKGKSFRRRS